MATTPVPAKTLAVFRSDQPSNKVFLPNGTACIFVNGKYVTDQEAIITALDAEIAKGNMMIRRGTPEDASGANSGDPLAALRAKFLAEFVADQERITAELTQGKDMGNSEQGPVKAMSSKDIAAVTVR